MMELPATSCMGLLALGAVEDVRELGILGGTVVLICLAAMYWAMFVRKAKKRRRKIHRPHTWQLDPNERRRGRHGRHGDRHRHAPQPELPMNPTLASTGGLPPKRTDDPASPSDSES